jgi:hypothetical protein
MTASAYWQPPKVYRGWQPAIAIRPKLLTNIEIYRRCQLTTFGLSSPELFRRFGRPVSLAKFPTVRHCIEVPFTGLILPFTLRARERLKNPNNRAAVGALIFIDEDGAYLSSEVAMLARYLLIAYETNKNLCLGML